MQFPRAPSTDEDLDPPAWTTAPPGRRTPKSSMPDVLHLYNSAVYGPRLDVARLRPSIRSMTPQKDWPHAPIHRLGSCGVYMVTGATLHKAHLFSTDEKLDLLEDHLLKLAKRYHWQLEACAVFVNHYHFIARGHPDALPLDALLNQLHSDTARKLNLQDQLVGREVWYNFWDTKLTFERSYLARLNYVHQNAVKHGLVYVANQYPWCSAAWFERTASLSAVNTIYSFKTDKLNIHDEY